MPTRIMKDKSEANGLKGSRNLVTRMLGRKACNDQNPDMVRSTSNRTVDSTELTLPLGAALTRDCVPVVGTTHAPPVLDPESSIPLLLLRFLLGIAGYRVNPYSVRVPEAVYRYGRRLCLPLGVRVAAGW